MAPHFPRGLSCLSLLSFLAILPVHAADYREDVGYTKLQAEFSTALPTGAGISVAQIEAPVEGGFHQPETTLAEFSGKTFTNKSTTTGVSGHATQVGQNYYGSTTSMAPGITALDVYNANGWIYGDYLRTGSFQAPKTENRDVENHSWIGLDSNSTTQDILRRLDFAIQRDDFVAVLGLNNGSGSSLPFLLGSSYNGIVVGLSNGNHSTGTTTIDGNGRLKPDLVSPSDATSFATPAVGAAAALLLQKIRSSATYSAADHSVVVKALLLAGATKAEFPTWSRSATQPLDAHYGAGQLNIFHSYHNLLAGRQAGGTTVGVKSLGWDYSSTSSSTPRLYFFDIPTNNTKPGFSAILTWNRIVSANFNWSTIDSSLADLTLRLYHASGYTVGSTVDVSTSAVDNVEHIHQPGLPPGRYAMEVSSTSGASTNYGLAWTSLANVQIVATTPVASEMGPTAGVFTVSRSGGDTTMALQVSYTIGGTATNGADYTGTTNSITFAAGETTKIITIAPVADSVVEGEESVAITLSPDLAYALDTNTVANITIHDLPFDAWRFGKFSTADLADSTISGPHADPDSDGIPNLLEYALALEPKTGSTVGLPFTALENGWPTLVYTRVKAATDLVYLPQISPDLQTWLSGSGYLTETSVTDNGLTETVKVSSTNNTAAAQFLRLRVSRP